MDTLEGPELVHNHVDSAEWYGSRATYSEPAMLANAIIAFRMIHPPGEPDLIYGFFGRAKHDI